MVLKESALCYCKQKDTWPSQLGGAQWILNLFLWSRDTLCAKLTFWPENACVLWVLYCSEAPRPGLIQWKRWSVKAQATSRGSCCSTKQPDRVPTTADVWTHQTPRAGRRCSLGTVAGICQSAEKTFETVFSLYLGGWRETMSIETTSGVKRSQMCQCWVHCGSYLTHLSLSLFFIFQTVGAPKPDRAAECRDVTVLLERWWICRVKSICRFNVMPPDMETKDRVCVYPLDTSGYWSDSCCVCVCVSVCVLLAGMCVCLRVNVGSSVGHASAEPSLWQRNITLVSSNILLQYGEHLYLK